MDTKIMDKLEILEDRIEGIKWLITSPFYLKKAAIPNVINIIRKSAGILGKDFSKGITLENKIRREWKTNFLKRITS